MLAVCSMRKLYFMLNCPSSVECKWCVHLNEKGAHLIAWVLEVLLKYLEKC